MGKEGRLKLRHVSLQFVTNHSWSLHIYALLILFFGFLFKCLLKKCVLTRANCEHGFYSFIFTKHNVSVVVNMRLVGSVV